MVSPLLLPVWIAGLLTPFRRSSLRTLRFVPLTYAALAVAYLIGNGKAYYLASMYPVLLGLGAISVADWTAHSRKAGRRITALSVLVGCTTIAGECP